ncbi:MAG: polysaccharide export protein [Candidatus Omnitrophica bacterium]|nr:polysaccharide export protein [Candidatus Omnitrophota bacterium]
MLRLSILIIGLLVNLVYTNAAWCRETYGHTNISVPGPEVVQTEEPWSEQQKEGIVITIPEDLHTPPPPAPLELSNPYTLGPGDVINISVLRHPEFSGDFVIDPYGNIQYPYVGDVKAEGRNKHELQGDLRERLRVYVKVPEVSVTIREYMSKSVYIMGQVSHPGKYNMRGDSITLREAVFQAGLPTDVAQLRSVHVIHPVEEGKPVVEKVNLKKILYEGNLAGNVVLEPGDIVVVNATALHKVWSFINKLLAPVTNAATAYFLFD